MAALRIIRPPASGDHAGDVPRSQWDELLLERRTFCSVYLPQDCRNLMFFVEDGAANDWLGLGSRERYLREGLGLDPQLVAWALDGLRQLRPDEAAGLDQAVVLGKHGRPKKGEEKGGVTTLTANQKNTVKHILARLKRDHPDIAERFAAGEFKSTRAAARAAGIKVDATPIQLLRRTWKRATPEERAAFLAEVTSGD